MVTGIIGRKVGMTQVFDADGTVHPATVIKAGPVRRRAGEERADRRLRGGAARARRGDAGQGRTSRLAGHFKKANVPPTRVRREVKLAAGGDAPKAGDQVLASIFANGERVDVDRHRPRQGLPGRRQAASLRRRRGDARLDVPPRARIDWRLVVSVARRQGHARRRADGRRPGDDSQPEGAARRPGQPPADRRRRHSRARRPSYVIVRKAVTAKKIKVAQVEKPKKGKK